MPSVEVTSSDSRQDAFYRYVIPELEVLEMVARRITFHPSDAEDVVQETLLRAYRAIDRFDGRYPRAWLLTILRNCNINRLREQRPILLRGEDRTLQQLVAPGADGHPDGAAETALSRIADPAIRDALRRLSSEHREVVRLVDVEGLPYREAAAQIGVPLGTVMSRLHRARAHLRRQLRSCGHPYAAARGPADRTRCP